MVKIWCEKCRGRGHVTGYKTYDMPPLENCKACHGKGYTESPETQRLLAIGSATVEAFEYGGMPSISYLTLAELWPDGTAYDPIELYSVEELLEWHKEREATHGQD